MRLIRADFVGASAKRPTYLYALREYSACHPCELSIAPIYNIIRMKSSDKPVKIGIVRVGFLSAGFGSAVWQSLGIQQRNWIAIDEMQCGWCWKLVKCKYSDCDGRWYACRLATETMCVRCEYFQGEVLPSSVTHRLLLIHAYKI